MTPGSQLPDGRRLVSVPDRLQGLDILDRRAILPSKDMDLLVLGRHPPGARPSTVMVTAKSGRLAGVRSAQRVPTWNLPVSKGQPVQLPEGAWAAFAPGDASAAPPDPRPARLVDAIQFTMGKKSGLGDKICALTAVREFARRNPGRTAFFDELPSVVEAFGDGLVVPGRRDGAERVILLDCEPRFRVKGSSPDLNLVGCFMAHLGMRPDGRGPELPEVGEVLPRGTYVTVQPRARHARNPPQKWVQNLVDHVRTQTGLQVIVIGNPNTSKFLLRVEYILTPDVLPMFSLIRHAALMLAPPSAGTHIAAAYQTHLISWLGKNGEDWLSTYALNSVQYVDPYTTIPSEVPVSYLSLRPSPSHSGRP